MSSNDPSDSNKLSWTRFLGGVAVTAAVTGAAAGTLIYVGVDPEVVPAVLSLLLGVFFTLVTWVFQRGDDMQIRESRERVRAAERGFEAALRNLSARSEARPEGGSEVLENSESGPQGNILFDHNVGSPVVQVRDIEGIAFGETNAEYPSPRLNLPELWAVTHARLELYHDIATGQARRSFRNAQLAMLVGFGLLVGFVAIALNASTTAGSVVAGGLGAVSAALAGYVSRTFVKSQEVASSHLRAYFDQPLEFSRYLAAERLVANAELSQEQRAEIVTTLVQAIVTGPGVPAQADANGQQQPGRAQ
ncbi:hypothetical protein ABZ817_38320 [Streptomyces antimycoticus]|uniref:hypothetical protein n=1 Tax=Streptomyces antimycoticus TaxID=68175 RepID=UPI0033EBED78